MSRKKGKKKRTIGQGPEKSFSAELGVVDFIPTCETLFAMLPPILPTGFHAGLFAPSAFLSVSGPAAILKKEIERLGDLVHDACFRYQSWRFLSGDSCPRPVRYNRLFANWLTTHELQGLKVQEVPHLEKVSVERVLAQFLCHRPFPESLLQDRSVQKLVLFRVSPEVVQEAGLDLIDLVCFGGVVMKMNMCNIPLGRLTDRVKPATLQRTLEEHLLSYLRRGSGDEGEGERISLMEFFAKIVSALVTWMKRPIYTGKWAKVFLAVCSEEEVERKLLEMGLLATLTRMTVPLLPPLTVPDDAIMTISMFEFFRRMFMYVRAALPTDPATGWAAVWLQIMRVLPIEEAMAIGEEKKAITPKPPSATASPTETPKKTKKTQKSRKTGSRPKRKKSSGLGGSKRSPASLRKKLASLQSECSGLQTKFRAVSTENSEVTMRLGAAETENLAFRKKLGSVERKSLEFKKKLGSVERKSLEFKKKLGVVEHENLEFKKKLGVVEHENLAFKRKNLELKKKLGVVEHENLAFKRKNLELKKKLGVENLAFRKKLGVVEHELGSVETENFELRKKLGVVERENEVLSEELREELKKKSTASDSETSASTSKTTIGTGRLRQAISEDDQQQLIAELRDRLVKREAEFREREEKYEAKIADLTTKAMESGASLFVVHHHLKTMVQRMEDGFGGFFSGTKEEEEGEEAGGETGGEGPPSAVADSSPAEDGDEDEDDEDVEEKDIDGDG